MRKAFLFTLWAWPFLLFAGIVNALWAHLMIFLVDLQPDPIPVENRFVFGLVFTVVITVVMSPMYFLFCHTEVVEE